MFREKEFSEVSYVCQELGYYLVIVSEEIYASTNTKKLHRVLKEISQNSLSHLEK